MPQAWKKDYAKTLKQTVDIPVIAVNNIKYPKVAEGFLEEGVSDFVGLARASLADPQWGNKAKAGKDTYIRTCVGCMNCFGQLMKYDRPVTCTVNPELGKEYLYTDLNKLIAKTGQGKKLVVIGAGPTGSEAAIVLAKRGYDVTIFDKNDSPGGAIRLGAKPAFKSYFYDYITMLENTMKDLGVDLRFNEEATVDKVKEINPYGVIVAVGGQPQSLSIEGLDDQKLLSYEDILGEKIDLTGKDILVVGGGETGLETGEFLADKNNKVTVIEMLDEVGKELEVSTKAMMLKRFSEKQIPVLTKTTIKKVDGSKAKVENLETNEAKDLNFDYVVAAIGVKNNPDYNNQFLDAFENSILIGDARKPRNIVLGTREAYDKAFVF